MSAQDLQRATRNFSVLVVGGFISKGLLFAWQIVLGNWFLPDEYGIYNTVTSLMAVSAILVSMGMSMIAIREVARKPHLMGHYWATMLWLQGAFVGVAYVLMMGLAVLSGYSDAILAYASLAGLSLLIDSFGNIAHDLLLARERMTITASVEIVHIVARVGLAWVALQLGLGLLGVYGVTLLAGIGRSGALSYAHWRAGLRPLFPLQREIVLPLLRDSAPLALSAFLTLAYQHADKLMTTAFLGERNTGYLAPAFIINFGMTELISTTILVAVYPVLSRYYYDSALRELFGRITETLARVMLMVSLPIVLGLSVFSLPIVLAIYNENYRPTAGVLSILVWYTLIMMVGNVFAKSLLIQNRQRTTLWIRGVSLLINVTMNAFFLIRTQDPRGTAVASVLAETFALGAMLWHFRSVGFLWGRFFARIVRTLGAGAVMAAVMLAIGSGQWGLALVAGGISYGVALLGLGAVTRQDWDIMEKFLGALPFGERILTLVHRWELVRLFRP